MSDSTFGYLTPENLSLFTDLYELRMMQGFYLQDHNPTASFSLFFRELPEHRGYMIAAGLEQVLAYIEDLQFTPRTIDYLAEQGFDPSFLEYLRSFEFTGSIRAVPEGTPIFADEPIVEVTGPIIQGQLLETLIINQIGFQTLIATKAARMLDVIDRSGSGQQLVDFGSRRAHGTDGGIKAARAAYLGGFDGTSNVAAGELFNIPVVGTMAHSWIQSFPDEREAYETFLEEYGENSILLIDTYDTLEGARLTKEILEDRSDLENIAGVRLDSGDLVGLSRDVNEILPETDQYISSGMDEYSIAEFLDNGGIGVGFGPGTSLVTSADAPTGECVYKLVAVDQNGKLEPTMKMSTGKVTYPGEKSLRRITENDGFSHDVVGLRDEDLPGKELLQPVVAEGEIIYDIPALDTIKENARSNRQNIPVPHRKIREPEPYPVIISTGLQTMTDELQSELEAKHPSS